MIEPRQRHRHLDRVGVVIGLHGCAQLPGDDVAREIVEGRRHVEPAPTYDCQAREVRLPELVLRRRLLLERLDQLQKDVSWQDVSVPMAATRGSQRLRKPSTDARR